MSRVASLQDAELVHLVLQVLQSETFLVEHLDGYLLLIFLVNAFVHLAEAALPQEFVSVLIVVSYPPPLLPEGAPQCAAPPLPLGGIFKVQDSFLTQAQLDVDLEEQLVAELALGHF